MVALPITCPHCGVSRYSYGSCTCVGADPRKAKTLGEACANGDGTFNGIRALSFLSGLHVSEVEKIKDHVVAKLKSG